MTGYQSKKKAASAKTIDEVHWADHEPDGLIQPAQEPVAEAYALADSVRTELDKQSCPNAYMNTAWEAVVKHHRATIYTTPPAAAQRTWVGLTDEDMKDPKTHNFDFIYGARWAEAKLKEKNT